MNKIGFLIDMDGVIYRGSEIIPGGKEFISYLEENNIPYLFLTNNSKPSPRDVAHRLNKIGFDVHESHIYTSAMATAKFIASQKKTGSAYVLGEGGLLKAMDEVGYAIDDSEPDYVIVGEGRTLTLEMVEHAIDLIIDGAKLIATNLDPAPKIKGWAKPGTGAVIAMIEEATGAKAFSVGKPSPIMMREARKYINVSTDETYMIGDTMETDIQGGVLMSYKTILTLSGTTKREELKNYPYQPHYIVDSVKDVIKIIEEIRK
jgi:NagD protein